MTVLDSLEVPIIAAPMAGGPSTPELVAAVAEAGGLGFLAGGTSKASRLSNDIDAVQTRYGVNLFYPQSVHTQRDDLVSVYEQLCQATDDYNYPNPYPVPNADYTFGFSEKFALVLSLPAEKRPAVVSTSFGSFSAEEIASCHAADVEAWVNVTSVKEAKAAAAAGADVLVVQGADAGGHRLTWDPLRAPNKLQTHELTKKIAKVVRIPLVAAGGVREPDDVRSLLAIKRVTAVQTGSMFLRAKEAGTLKYNRKLIKQGGQTVVSRAFSGRFARGLTTQWATDHPDLPMCYPQLATMFALSESLRTTPEFAYCFVGERLENIRRKKAHKIIEFLNPEAHP